MHRVLFSSLVVVGIMASSFGRADQVVFDSVDQLLADLRSDLKIEFREEGRWLIAEGDFTIWTFTLSGHPAHPAVVERRVYEDGGSIRIGTRTICTADQSVCNQFFGELAGQDVSRSTGGRDRAVESRQTIDQPGFSISLSNPEVWTVARRSAVMLVLRREGTREGDSIVGAVQLERLPTLTSDQDFLSLVITQREQGLGSDPRVSSPSFVERLVSLNGNTCVEFAYRYLDVGAVLEDGSTTEMTFAESGMRCQHPSDPTIGVRISYSVRQKGGVDTLSFESSARNFADSIAIKPLETGQ